MFLLPLAILPSLLAQTGEILDQPSYVNQLYDGVPTNAPDTSLAQTTSVALFSGETSDITNSPAPTDGQLYLTQCAIGQGIGGVPLAFYLLGVTMLVPANATVFTAPANISLNAQAYQLDTNEFVQSVSFYVSGATNGLIATITNFAIGTNSFQTSWSNDVVGTCTITAVATDNLGNSSTSAPVSISVVPVIYVNGQYSSTHAFTFLATNPLPVVTMTNPLPGSILYTTDGTDPFTSDSWNYFEGAFTVTSSEVIRAGTTDENQDPLAEVDPVTITLIPMYNLNATTLGGGFINASLPNGLYSNNTVVILTAVTNGGWTFMGWTGDETTNSSAVTLTLTSNITVEAVFGTNLPVQQLTHGVVNISPVQSLYPYGSVVQLTAVPTNTYYFSTWLFNFISSGNMNPLNLVVNSNLPPLIQPGFAPVGTNFSLTVEVGSGNGAVTPSPYGTVFSNGAPVSIMATNASGEVFTGWSGNASGIANPLPLIMRSNTIIIANFATNAPPAVSITNPADGATLMWPATICLRASASSPGGTVTNVSFFAGTNQIGVATNVPFSLAWSNAPMGASVLTAVAIANTGLSATSPPVSLTVIPSTNPPIFQFSSASYAVNENGGSVTLTVVNNGGQSGYVSYQTLDGTAYGGNGFSGSYTITGGALTFSNGQTSSTMTIPIIDNFLDAPPVQFQVQLSDPSAGVLGTPLLATVTIYLNDLGGATNSLLNPYPPSLPQPQMNSQLTVLLTPTNTGGQWRFPWDLGWRNSGDTVAGLVAGNYQINFRQVPNYLAVPETLTVGVTNSVVVTNQYYSTVNTVGSNSTGSLTVTFSGAAGGGGWQFVGDTVWLPSGFTTNLLPDTYFIQFEPVNGWFKPASLAVQVFGGENTSITEAYLQPQTPPSGATFPNQVPASGITDNGQPYRFNGQLQTDVGFGSGVAVRENIVLTAAHMVFNDETLSYVSQAYWDFQEEDETGGFEPEPLAARGWYVLSGYASQRTNDLANGYVADGSSTNSQDLDVAALYFLTPVARGGYGGYLASDTAPNQWLNTAYETMLVGYPVDGSQFGNASIVPGTMYATFPQKAAFTQVFDQVYSTPSFLSFPGNSGGPVYVQYNTGVWYPAAVYLGTSGSDQASASIMRAIDSNVVNIINLAASQGDAGTNNSGGGVITIIANGVSSAYPGIVANTLPIAAFLDGGAWALSNANVVYSVGNPAVFSVTTTNQVELLFKPIPGWNLPPNQSVSVVATQRESVINSYTVAVTSAPVSIEYGTPLASNQLNLSVPVITNGTSGTYTFIPPLGTILNAGTNTLVVGFTPTDTLDYGAFSSNNVNLVVTPAHLTVTATSVTCAFGQPIPAFTGTITGVSNNDNITAQYNCSANVNSPPGVYIITPTLVDPNDRLTNYVYYLVNGTLTITGTGELVQNGGFETGTFSSWTLSANAIGNIDVTGGITHSGHYAAQLGVSGALGYLSQQLPTSIGQLYLLSLWMDSPDGETPNEFSVAWNGANVFDQKNIGAIGWTNLQFAVTATSTSTLLSIGFRDDPIYLYLDDVSVLPLARTVLRQVTVSVSTMTFNWSALAGEQYQIQSATNLTQAIWPPVGGIITANGTNMTTTLPISTNKQLFYRVVFLP